MNLKRNFHSNALVWLSYQAHKLLLQEFQYIPQNRSLEWTCQQLYQRIFEYSRSQIYTMNRYSIANLPFL